MFVAANSNLTGVASSWGKVQDIVYIGQDNHIYLLNFNRRDRFVYPWTQYDLNLFLHNHFKLPVPYPIAGRPGPRQGCPLASFSLNNYHSNFLVYFGSTEDEPILIEGVYLEQNSVINFSQVPNLVGKYVPAQDSRLAAYAWQTVPSAHVIYVDANGDLIELWLNAFPPYLHGATNLSAATGFQGFNAPKSSSPLAGYAFENQGTQHVFYIAKDNTIRELYYSGGNWFGNNLSQSLGPPAPAPGSPLAAYVQEFDNTQHVIYIAHNGDIQELYWAKTWNSGQPDLTKTTGTPQPAANSDLAGYSAEYEQTEHVVYVGVDGHIHELWNKQGWFTTDLTLSANATLPRDATPLAGYSFENEQTHHVAYVDANGDVHELYRSGNTWGSGVISGSLPIIT
jgi:hypothetical protein